MGLGGRASWLAGGERQDEQDEKELAGAGAGAPATVARGFARDAGNQPFRLVSVPAAWTPSTRPFDRGTGPSGDTVRVTQSAAVCRRFRARGSPAYPNSRFCPAPMATAIRARA